MPVAGVTVFGVTVFSTGATSLLVVVVVVQSGGQYCAAAALFPFSTIQTWFGWTCFFVEA